MASTLLCSQLLLVVLVVVYLVVYGYVTDNSGVGAYGKMGLFHPVRSKYSCGLAMIVVEEPTKPLSTLDRRVRVRLHLR